MLGAKKYRRKKESSAAVSAERKRCKKPFLAMVKLLADTLPHLAKAEK